MKRIENGYVGKEQRRLERGERDEEGSGSKAAKTCVSCSTGFSRVFSCGMGSGGLESGTYLDTAGGSEHEIFVAVRLVNLKTRGKTSSPSVDPRGVGPSCRNRLFFCTWFFAGADSKTVGCEFEI